MATSAEHHELCETAGRWLRGSAVVCHSEFGKSRMRCGVVLTELVTSAVETPDAIGWAIGGRFSILVEVKVSRADFRKDLRKPFRVRPERGVGQWRYYLAPAGLISAEELPERWGLLERAGGRIIVAKLAEPQPRYHVKNELSMLWSFANRVQLRKEQMADICR